MKIIILGAGQVGSSVAASLVGEENDITVVDTNPAILQTLSERYDLRTITGVASHPSVLKQAGGNDADMVIAITNSDEINMIACQVAYTLFHTPTKIARVRNVEYLKNIGLFAQEALPIDVLISPEQIVTDYIKRLIDYPNALQVLEFAEGKAQIVAVKVPDNGMLTKQRIADLARRFTAIDFRVIMMYRGEKLILPDKDTKIEADDEVFFVGSKKHIRRLLQMIGNKKQKAKRIIIAGGGQIGTHLALLLEKKYKVKLIELDLEHARSASEALKDTIVLHGDATNEELLADEDIENTDVFCALTNTDEANIISSILAKRMGAKKVMSLINRAAYVNLIQRETIDIAISPQQATIGSLLPHIRHGDVVVVHALRGDTAEAIETIAHGDASSSKIVGKTIGAINFPPGVSVGAIVRGEEVLIARDDTAIKEEDHVILLVSDKKYLADVELLFRVGITFI